MMYWTAAVLGLCLGGTSAYFYIGSIIRRHALGLSTPYSRESDATAFNNTAEHLVYETLKDTFDAMCGHGNYILSKGPLILTHAPGRPIPTCEVDHLVICSFGVFVVETKGWNGTIRPGPSCETVAITFKNGEQTERRSPLAQCASKTAFIRRCQPCDWRVESLAVFAHPEARLASGLPTNMILAQDIRRYFQQKRMQPMTGEIRYVDVELAYGATCMHRDLRPNAVALHVAAVTRS